MSLNGIIKDRRIKKGMSKLDVANAVGLTVHEYDDIEAYESELYDVVIVGKIKSICKLLDIDISYLFGFESSSELDSSNVEDLVRSKRNERNLSIKAISDEVGIEEQYILRAEKDAKSLDDWVMVPLIEYAKVLGVSPACLL